MAGHLLEVAGSEPGTRIDEKGLEKAAIIATNKYPGCSNRCKMVFNVRQPTAEPIINLADYFLWAVQRKWERNESRYIDFLGKRIRSIQNLYNGDDEN